jgi:hypothetical protein
MISIYRPKLPGWPSNSAKQKTPDLKTDKKETLNLNTDKLYIANGTVIVPTNSGAKTEQTTAILQFLQNTPTSFEGWWAWTKISPTGFLFVTDNERVDNRFHIMKQEPLEAIWGRQDDANQDVKEILQATANAASTENRFPDSFKSLKEALIKLGYKIPDIPYSIHAF